MTKKDLVIVVNETQSDPMSLSELCANFDISPEFIRELIAFEIIQTAQEAAEQRLFNMLELQRIKRAIRLQRDLEVNFAGIAVILDLLDELEELRRKSQLFEKHFSSR
jgi:chaperone modulatory protein CbpM